MYSFDKDAVLGINPDGTAMIDIRKVLQSPTYNPDMPGQSVAFPGLVPPVSERPPIKPMSDISMTPAPQDFDAANAQDPANRVPLGEDMASGPQRNPVAAQDTVGETEKSPTLQPGNRKSIKEYLADIRTLREQQRAAGVPEDQLAVPTFTNVQGGPLDKSQGYIPGQRPDMMGREVRSYMWPEYKQGPTDMSPMQRGVAHPITQARQAFQKFANVTNEFDPRWPGNVVYNTIDEALEQERRRTGSWPSPERSQQILNGLQKAAFEAQGKNIEAKKKMFPGADVQALFNAYESGNWSFAADAKQNMLSNAKIGQVTDEAFKEWSNAMKDNMAPINPDTGEPFASPNEYSQWKVESYVEMVQGMIEAMDQFQSQGGPQSGGQLPPEAQQKLRAAIEKQGPGSVVQFENGQMWTIDPQTGQPKQIKQGK